MLLSLFASIFLFSSLEYSSSANAQEMQYKKATDEKETAKDEKTFDLPAPADFQRLRTIGTVKVKQIINALSLRLDDGRIVQLSGIDMPDLTPYEAGDIAVTAQDALTKLLTDKNIVMHQTKDKSKGRNNRMGYDLAQIELSANAQPSSSGKAEKKPIWVQGYLLLNGLARARPTTRNPEMATQMYALEDMARKNNVGMWDAEKYPDIAVRTPETADNVKNSFAIVEGTIKSAATVNNTIYLNFGKNWRTDFTIGVESTVRRKISREMPDMNLLSLQGQTVRVRGWVEDYNGPFIRLEHPAMLEFPKAQENETSLDNG